ncbi:hypothetical protein L798_02774 [Zootermopsis nevadensis]|uniref:Histidine-rich glycoprotein n=1 Tax=Zootermopsis nevadensis TaxID=136037 RepID=A0A067RD86_ZOONE|nr:hypothetical protein L798_02774 [Zootermopsis nevadensis]
MNKGILFVFLILAACIVKGDPGTIIRYRHHVVPVSRYIYSHYHDYHDHHDHVDHLYYPDHYHYHDHHW